MQEGTIFFLISWLTVWYIVFMDNKSPRQRRVHLTIILALLVCAGVYMNIGNIQVSLIWVPVLFWSFFQWRIIRNRDLFRVSVSVFGVMLAFACFRILTMLYPVWLFIDWKILCSLLVIAVSALFLKGPNMRLSTLIIGSLFGQMIFAVLLNINGMPINYLFSLESMDLLSLLVFMNGVLHLGERWLAKWSLRKSSMTVAARNRDIR
ncbi:YphA family membrane protein [Pradoshia eiseniae]